MNDYKKSDFYHFYDAEKGKRRFFIKVRGAFIEVSKEVYYICFNSYRKQIRTNRKEEEHGVISYDRYISDGHNLLDTIGITYDYLEELYKKELLSRLELLIEHLEDQDKDIIKELLINGKKEREIADRYHISQQMISAKKKRILRLLRKRLIGSDEKKK